MNLRKVSPTRVLTKNVIFIFRLVDLENVIWHWNDLKKSSPTLVLANKYSDFVACSHQIRSMQDSTCGGLQSGFNAQRFHLKLNTLNVTLCVMAYNNQKAELAWNIIMYASPRQLFAGTPRSSNFSSLGLFQFQQQQHYNVNRIDFHCSHFVVSKHHRSL